LFNLKIKVLQLFLETNFTLVQLNLDSSFHNITTIWYCLLQTIWDSDIKGRLNGQRIKIYFEGMVGGMEKVVPQRKFLQWYKMLGDHCSGLKSEFLCNIHIMPQYQNYYVTHNVRITMYHTMSELLCNIQCQNYYVTQTHNVRISIYHTMSELLCSTQCQNYYVPHNVRILCNRQWCHNVRITM
jgi:hypothetical protein